MSQMHTQSARMTQSAIYLFSLCEYECVCMCTQVHAPRCVRGGLERMSGALFYPCPLYFLETGSLTGAKAGQAAPPASDPPHTATPHLVLGCWMQEIQSQVFMVAQQVC